ncbi:MAG: FUSC family protein, partial [Actinomycetes bacterium]
MASQLGEFGTRVLRFDRDAIDWRLAARRSAAVLMCAVVGVLTDHLALSLTAALGALLVGILFHREPYRQQVQTLAVGLVFLTSMIVLGGLVSQFGWLRLPLSALAALACGLAAAWGPRLGTAASISLAMFAMYSGTPLSVDSVLITASVFVAGGLLQAVLLMAGWLLRHPDDVTEPIAGAWQAIGLAARRGDVLEPGVALAVEAARERAAGLSVAEPEAADLVRLSDDAETVRMRLIVGGPHTNRDQILGQRTDPSGSAGVRSPLPSQYMRTVADACVQIGRAVSMRSDVQLALAAVARVHDYADVDPGARADRSMIDHALGDAVSAVAGFHRPSGHSAAARSAGGPIYTRPLSLGWQSPVVRESVRLCITFTLATALGMWLLDYRSSWVPFTVALVTQPGYVSAINRAVLRLAGTMVGIGLSAVLVELVPQRSWWMAVIAAGSAFAIYSLAPANYGAAVVFITVFALMPLDFLHGPIGEALLFRGLATLLGGLIVIVGAMIAPRRSAPKLAPRLADYADAVHRSITLVLAEAQKPDHAVALKFGHSVQSAVVATLDQAWAEPAGHGLDA